MIPGQPHRLAASHGSPFAAREIDRSKPLSFSLNGRVVHGYHGDTVLTAALASGITAAGTRAGEAIALTERFAPPVRTASSFDPALTMPMACMPAIDGLELVTVGPRPGGLWRNPRAERLRDHIAGPPRTLGHRFDSGPVHLPELPISEELAADLVVIGAGVAGLGAALAAARSGERVILIERRPWLGGDATYFPTLDGEEPPQQRMSRLQQHLAQLPNVRVLTGACAIGLRDQHVTVRQVVTTGRSARPLGIRIASHRIILATGASERLPIFPGNRSPGVETAVAAFTRAERYGVWNGRRSLIITASNLAYRLAVHAADAGIELQRIVDVRSQASSRFIDFSKAFGIQLAMGLAPYAAIPPPQGLAGLHVHFAVALDGTPTGEPIWTEQLIVSAGWQGRLRLWLEAGGKCQWSEDTRSLMATSELEGVALAGSAAGLVGTAACQRSGEAAVARLFGRPALAVSDSTIDPRYETPDGVFLPIWPHTGWRKRSAYLDGGSTLAALTPPKAYRGVDEVPLSNHRRHLSLGDIGAAVQLGEVAPQDAGSVAAQLVITPDALVPSPATPIEATATTPYPAYLTGRFGQKPALWMIEPLDARTLEPGCLLYLGSEDAEPGGAIGVVVAPTAPGARGALALLGKVRIATGDQLALRDTDNVVLVRVAERVAPAAD